MEKDLIWEEFEHVRIHVGTIVQVNEFPEAKKAAWKLLIDFGEYGLKKSSAQITDLYTPSELIGKQIVAVLNFPDKQIGPFISECLVLGAVGEEQGVVLLQTERKVPNGSRIA